MAVDNMQINNNCKPTLYYVYDPMCSWCWGYAVTWQKLRTALEESAMISVQYRLGGLAPDSSEPMPQEMQNVLQQTWHNISTQLGTEFNHDFWAHCQPRRSTYPACRAALIAREAGLEQQMLQGIQTAYYLQAKNPSDLDTLVDLADSIGLNSASFKQQMKSESLNTSLMNEISTVRQLPIQGFPSLVLELENQLTPITLDYQHWQTTFEQIMNEIALNK
ncbi:DsbA family protein [Shewanella sp.]|uniref:DsbA family protein n=1 Tax=Shewanella sp. TaxID=50422 RepID=UPI00258EF79A|nr:DsbA family protein [Shewanella sp.]MCJ8305056.1 DsbA family protein [Shewanella sp.]